MKGPTLVVLGPFGTRWLFKIIVASALFAWASETALGVIEPSDRIAYPLLAVAFTALALLVWRWPQQLFLWQRIGVTLVGLYFALSMLVFTMRPDPGPGPYTLASFGPWSMGGTLLLFTTWRARDALCISLGLQFITLAPPTWLRFAGTPPQWLADNWPLLANLALCQGMFSLALWGLSRQLARLTSLAAAPAGIATPDGLVAARLAELERSRAAAEAASRAKSDFLANIGHEIRTPMNTVLGITRLLLQGRVQNEQRARLQEVAKAGESLVKMIDGLLDFADLDAGRMQLNEAAVPLEPLLAHAFDAVRPHAQAKHLALDFELGSPELLGAAGTRRGDAVRLTQLVTELLTNAVKFTPAGSVVLNASVDAAGGWVLQVRDSGVGMDQEQLARLFTPFAQADAGATRRYGGTGLGLAVCRALAERMGGSLTARSTPDTGSEFTLTLPPSPCPGVTPSALRAPARLMLVQAPHADGHQSLVSLLKAMAPEARLDIVSQARQALHRLTAATPAYACDLLIVDWVLPDMEGGELLAQLAAQSTPHGPAQARRVVLLSAFDTQVLRDRAIRQGAQTVCAKPLLPHALRRLLDFDRPLPADMTAPEGPPSRAPAPPAASTAVDVAALVRQLDHLLGEADSHALTLWEQHEATFIEALPVTQAKALAGAMQRFDFDAAQAALRGGSPP